jgi:hypothetical protein
VTDRESPAAFLLLWCAEGSEAWDGDGGSGEVVESRVGWVASCDASGSGHDEKGWRREDDDGGGDSGSGAS